MQGTHSAGLEGHWAVGRQSGALSRTVERKCVADVMAVAAGAWHVSADYRCALHDGDVGIAVHLSVYASVLFSRCIVEMK